jgi:DNA-directed RNA polymerase subunit omega
MSMIKPSIEELMPKAENKYTLVVMASKRARNLVRNPQNDNDDWIQEKPVSKAFREIAEDLISYAPAPDESIPEIVDEQVELLEDFEEGAEEGQPDMEDGAEPND